MGNRVFRRPILACKGGTFSTGITVAAGVITQTAGNLAMTAGGVDLPVATGTTGTDLVNYGVSIVGTSSAAGTYTLAAPTQGVQKFVELRGCSSSIAHVLRASTAGAVTFDGVNHLMTVTTAGDEGVITMNLIGVSATRWSIQGYLGTLTLSTS